MTKTFLAWNLAERVALLDVAGAAYHVDLRGLVLPENGAGDGNRTHGEGAFEPLKQAVSCDDGCQV